jgi:hypothetical protein
MVAEMSVVVEMAVLEEMYFQRAPKTTPCAKREEGGKLEKEAVRIKGALKIVKLYQGQVPFFFVQAHPVF